MNKKIEMKSNSVIFSTGSFPPIGQQKLPKKQKKTKKKNKTKKKKKSLEFDF